VRSLENPLPSTAPDPSVRTVQAVSRTFLLLRTLGQAGRPMSLSDLARRIDSSKPSTYHLLRTLLLERAVQKNSDGLYELGWGLWELGSSVVRSNDLARVARFHLDLLAEQTGEAVLLSILDGKGVLYLDRGQSSSGFELVANIGRRSSLHANASGKVLLAYADEDFVDEVLATPLKAFTSNSITEPDALRAELARIREVGHAVCWQEQEIGMSSLGVPIRDHSQRVVAALALAGPAARINERTEAHLVDLLGAEADAISAGLGAQVAPR
jgi:DNA-binding IclR family transcriptional regulator